MLKSELIKRMQARSSLAAPIVSKASDILLDTISGALAEGRRVEIRGFGAFKMRAYIRRHRNSITKFPSIRILFKMGNVLKYRLDKIRLTKV